MPNAVTSEEKLSWMINVLRLSISLDWAKLATELLTPGERKTITQRLMASTRALKEIKQGQDRIVVGRVVRQGATGHIAVRHNNVFHTDFREGERISAAGVCERRAIAAEARWSSKPAIPVEGRRRSHGYFA